MIKNTYNTSGALTETVYYVSDELVRVVNSSGTYDTTYVKHEGVRVGELRDDGSKYFIHGDHLGSTSLTSDSSGNAVDNVSYSPFGLILEGGNASRYDYTGQEYDDVIDDYDYNARRYKAEWGKFTSPDPVIQGAYDPQTLNHFSYVRNNPYLFVDPNGEDFRLYYDSNAALGQGHFSIGIDLADEPGYEAYFEIIGIGEDIGPTISNNKYPVTGNDFVRYTLSILGGFDAKKNPMIRKYRDSQGNILLPSDLEGNPFDDYFAFEQDSTMDYKMLQEALLLTGKDWSYNAIVHNSMHFVINIVQTGYEVNFFGSRPQSLYNSILDGKAIYSKSGQLKSYYQVVSGEKQYKVWNNGRGRATGNAYCKKGC